MSLSKKILNSIYLYETKRVTTQSAIQLVLIIVFCITILVFGGVIVDIVTENQLLELISNWRISNTPLIGSILIGEIPYWLFLLAGGGVVGVVTLLWYVIGRRRVILHKIQSILSYWFGL